MHRPLSTILGVLLLALTTGASAAPPPSPHRASLIELADGPALPGTTRPAQQATLSVPFDTLLRDVRVEDGQAVHAGDVIAVLDDRVARAALHVAELDAANTAALQRAEATLARAETVLARTVEARESGVANEDELDEAMSRHDIARADLHAAKQNLERARLQLELARARLEEHLVRAPFDATVLRVHAEAGVVLSPGEPIAELATLDQIRADLHLPADAVLGITEGQTCALALGRPLGIVLPARVRYIERRIEPASRTQRVVFEFTDPLARLPIGLLVEPADRLPTTADIARSRPRTETDDALAGAPAEPDAGP